MKFFRSFNFNGKFREHYWQRFSGSSYFLFDNSKSTYSTPFKKNFLHAILLKSARENAFNRETNIHNFPKILLQYTTDDFYIYRVRAELFILTIFLAVVLLLK